MASFGKYEVVEKVGEGGFGTVYRGRDPDLDRAVAIKIVSAPDPELRLRFLREAKIAAGLQHPGITTVFDFGVDQDRPYLVQEFLSGEDLDRVVARGAIDRVEALDWLIDTAEALAYAHERGIVHRDIKPGNLRLLDDGRIKIMDFGIAKITSAEDQLTRTGMTMGTAGYLPPEQVRGEPVDQRADIFSFGVLAYELLGRRRPFEGESLSSLLYRIAHEDHPPLREAWRDCPPELAATVDRCLAKVPGDRFPDLASVIANLRAARATLSEAPAEASSAAARVAPTVLAPVGGRAEKPSRDGAPDRRASHGDTYGTVLRLPRRSWLWAAAVVVAVATGLWALGLFDGSDTRGEDEPDGDPERSVVTEELAEGSGSGESGTEEAGRLPAARPTARETEARPVVVADPAAGERTAEREPPPEQRPARTEPAPAVPPPRSAAPTEGSGALLLIGGEPARAAATAQSALESRLAERGLRVSSGDSTEIGGDPAKIVEAVRRRGAAFAVVGSLQAEAQPSVGRFFTGRAVLDLRVYGAGGALLGSGTVSVGTAGDAGELAPSEMTALVQAAETVADRAASQVLAWTGGGS